MVTLSRGVRQMADESQFRCLLITSCRVPLLIISFDVIKQSLAFQYYMSSHRLICLKEVLNYRKSHYLSDGKC